MAFKNSTDEKFQEQISSNKLTLTQFSASWCQPCKILKPIVEKIMNNPKYDATADLAKFDIDIDVYKTFWTRADGTVSNSSYWNESMISTINKFKNGDYSEQYDILGIK